MNWAQTRYEINEHACCAKRSYVLSTTTTTTWHHHHHNTCYSRRMHTALHARTKKSHEYAWLRNGIGSCSWLATHSWMLSTVARIQIQRKRIRQLSAAVLLFDDNQVARHTSSDDDDWWMDGMNKCHKWQCDFAFASDRRAARYLYLCARNSPCFILDIPLNMPNKHKCPHSSIDSWMTPPYFLPPSGPLCTSSLNSS